MMRVTTLTPTLSRKREREQDAVFLPLPRAGEGRQDAVFLPLPRAGEGRGEGAA